MRKCMLEGQFVQTMGKDKKRINKYHNCGACLYKDTSTCEELKYKYKKMLEEGRNETEIL